MGGGCFGYKTAWNAPVASSQYAPTVRHMEEPRTCEGANKRTSFFASITAVERVQGYLAHKK